MPKYNKDDDVEQKDNEKEDVDDAASVGFRYVESEQSKKGFFGRAWNGFKKALFGTSPLKLQRPVVDIFSDYDTDSITTRITVEKPVLITSAIERLGELFEASATISPQEVETRTKDLVSNINNAITANETPTKKASDLQRQTIVQNILMLSSNAYNDLVLGPAIEYCKRRNLPEEEIDKIIGPLLRLDEQTDDRKQIPPTIAELKKAISGEKPDVFNYLSKTFDKQGILSLGENDFKALINIDIKKVNDQLSSLVPATSLEDIPKVIRYVASLDLPKENWNVQKSCLDQFFKYYIGLASNNPTSMKKIISECMKIADTRNIQNGRLSEYLVQKYEKDYDLLDTFASVVNFTSQYPDREERRSKIFDLLLETNQIQSAALRPLMLLNNEEEIVRGVTNALEKKKILSNQEMLPVVYSNKLQPLNKSRIINAYLRNPITTNFSSEEKTAMIVALLRNNLTPDTIKSTMNFFVKAVDDRQLGVVEKIVVNDSVLLKESMNYVTRNANLALQTGNTNILNNTVQATTDFLKDTLDFMQNHGYKDVLEEMPQVVQQDLVGMLLKTKYPQHAGILLQFMQDNNLNIKEYIDQNIANNKGVLANLTTNNIKSPNTLSRETLGVIMASNDRDYIGSLPKVIKNFAGNSSLDPKMFDYLLYSPHKQEHHNSKMSALTEMLKIKPQVASRDSLNRFTRMMLAVDDLDVLRNAKQVLEENITSVQGDLQKKFLTHIQEVSDGKKTVTSKDMEVNVRKVQYDKRQFVDQMDAEFKTQRNLSDNPEEEVLSRRNENFFITEINRLFNEEELEDFGLSYEDGEGSVKSDGDERWSSLSTSGSGRIQHKKVSGTLREIKVYLEDNATSLTKDVLSVDRYVLTQNDTERLSKTLNKLKELDEKLARFDAGKGESKSEEGNIVLVARELVNHAMEASTKKMSKQKIENILRATNLAVEGTMEVYRAAYEPLERFAKQTMSGIDKFISENKLPDNSPEAHLVSGRNAALIIDNLTKTLDHIKSSEYTGYAMINPVLYFMKRVHEIASGNIKISKEGVEELRMLTDRQLKETLRASKNKSLEIKGKIEALKGTEGEGKNKQYFSKSKGTETEFGIKIHNTVVEHTGSIIKTELEKMETALKKLKNKTNTLNYNDLHQLKKDLSKIKNDTKDAAIKNKASQVKFIINEIMDDLVNEAPSRGSAEKTRLQDMIKTTRGIIEIQQEEAIVKKVSAEIGTRFAQLQEKSKEIKESEDFTYDAKDYRRLDKRVKEFAEIASKIVGHYDFPASGIVGDMMLDVTRIAEKAKKGENGMLLSEIETAIEDLSAATKSLTKEALKFPLQTRVVSMNEGLGSPTTLSAPKMLSQLPSLPPEMSLLRMDEHYTSPTPQSFVKDLEHREKVERMRKIINTDVRLLNRSEIRELEEIRNIFDKAAHNSKSLSPEEKAILNDVMGPKNRNPQQRGRRNIGPGR